jgi:hypothetical protein
MRVLSIVTGILVAGLATVTVANSAGPENRRALYGETHVHSSYSFDAYIFGNRNDPDAAYRYAKGEAIKHPAGFDMKLKTPLDFQAVTDHAMYLGMVPAMFDTSTDVSNHPVATALRSADTALERRDAFQELFPYIGGIVEDDLLDMNIVRSTWEKVIEAAERHNEPGKFTTFIGYEYTSSQTQFENLHRNVIFSGSDVPDEPYSRLISRNPEKLWAWMDELRAKGIDSIAIPHNSNGSDGYMFSMATFEGDPLSKAYSETRMRNEPIVEVSQVKGTSETHPLLSPNDEFANFEIMPYQIATWRKSSLKGSYVREAYLNGLKLQAEGKGNPFKFGLISASDTHVGAGAFSESDYWSKIGIVDATPKLRGSAPLTWTERALVFALGIRDKFINRNVDPAVSVGTPDDNPAPGYRQMQWSTWGASGLAGLWAEENTRQSIFSAMRRKETFGTSGPRLSVRFFAAPSFPDNILSRSDMVAQAYKRGVSMGGDMRAPANSPSFLVWLTRDPASAPIQRVQVVKGWLENGETKEIIYDVACAGDAAVDPVTNRCPDNNATVDLTDCGYAADTGADELKTVWKDPDYDAGESAFYYVRGIENPTCRWSTWDAVRSGTPPNPSLHATLQERVWSSPIWLEAQ